MSERLDTVAGLKRALRPGATVRIGNPRHPEMSRIATVLPKTNTVDLVLTHPDAPNGSHLGWPRRDQLRPSDLPNSVDLADRLTGKTWLTITLLEEA